MEMESAVINEGHLERSSIPVQGISFGKRAISWIIDIVVVNLLTLGAGTLVLFLLIFVAVILGMDVWFDENRLVIGTIESIAIMIFYTTLFEGLYGATPGKLIMGMRVVMEGGLPCDPLAAFQRSYWRLVDGLFFGLPAFISMRPPRNQRIGDKRARTFVVRSGDPGIKESREWWRFLIAGGTFIVGEIFLFVIYPPVIIR